MKHFPRTAQAKVQTRALNVRITKRPHSCAIDYKDTRFLCMGTNRCARFVRNFKERRAAIWTRASLPTQAHTWPEEEALGQW